MKSWTRAARPTHVLTLRSAIRAAIPAAAVLAFVAAAPGSAQAAPAAPAQPKAASHAAAGHVKEEGSYSLGVTIGSRLKGLGLTPETVSLERFNRGVRDALRGKAKVTGDSTEKITAMVRASRATVAKANEAAARAFLAKNAKRKGVVTTPSGLEYRKLVAGKGTSPTLADQVTVTYRGTLLDGTVFDSTAMHGGKPATFPVNGIIKGWQEALTMMKPGAKWELFIPPSLAYADNSPPPIPPGSLLHFQVQLLSVKPASSAPSGSAQPPQGQ